MFFCRYAVYHVDLSVTKIVCFSAAMELSVPGPAKRDSKRNSLIDTINSAGKSVRKDSVTPLLFRDPEVDGRQSGKSSIASNPDAIFGNEKVRRFSRRLSLKPPPNVYG